MSDEVAKQKADAYTRTICFENPQLVQIAREDYLAGYAEGHADGTALKPDIAKESAAEKANLRLAEKLDFIIGQLEQIEHIASQENEPYSGSVARYALTVLHNGGY